MSEKISLSIFFPAYNEEENIQETVLRSIQVAESSPFIGDYELIVVNDGSSDETGAIAEEMALQNPHVRVVHHQENRGYGAALKTGLKAARMQYVFFTDADLQFDIVELNALLAHIKDFPVVISYRAPRQDPALRLLNAWGWSMLNRLAFGLNVRDIDSAFKVFRTDLVQDLRLRSGGAMINAEILVRLQRQGVAIKQIPVSHMPRTAGSPTGAKPSVIFRAFRELVALYSGELGSITQKQVLKFMVVGMVNTLLDISVYVLLTRGTALFAGLPVSAKFFSFLAGTLSSFILNRYWTFGITSRLTAAEIGRFYATVLLALGVNTTAMYFFTQVLRVYDLAALVAATGITFLFSYTLSKSWVFKPHSREIKHV